MLLRRRVSTGLSREGSFVGRGRAPNILCEYAFELAQVFSRFYGAYHILSESDDALRASRLGLCGLTLAVLTKVLDLLGIEVPERM